MRCFAMVSLLCRANGGAAPSAGPAFRPAFPDLAPRAVPDVAPRAAEAAPAWARVAGIGVLALGLVSLDPFAPGPSGGPGFGPAAAQAQDDGGGGFLTGMIEDALSSDKQQVRLFGFQGALSSRASFSRLTISDAEGTWLTVEGAELDWTRSALFSGRLEVNQLSARTITLERLPPGEESAGIELPSPTSTAVSLPELPVSVLIGRMAVETLNLGAPILGEAVSATLEGSLSLDGGNGAADITATRTDGKTGRLRLDGSFSNTDRDLKLDMELVEDPAGILANMLQLPGRPSVDFSIKGAAPISDFAADIRLETDGAPRVTGQLTFRDLPGAAGLGWGLELGGDISPLFDAAYRPFFGTSAELALQGQNLSDGGIRIDRLRIASTELQLDGSLELGSDGMPRRFDLKGSIYPRMTDLALLPLSGEEIYLGDSVIEASFDAAAGEAFTFYSRFADFKRGAVAIDHGSLSANGTITIAGTRQVLADLIIDVQGMDLGDAALNTALDKSLKGNVNIGWTEGGNLVLKDANLHAGALGFQGGATFSGLEGNLRIETDSTLTASFLAPLSDLAGQPLSGGASARVNGHYEPLGGAFDLALDVRTAQILLQDGLVNDLVRGDGSFTGRIARDATGTRIDNLQIATPQISGTFGGTIGPDSGDLTLDARLQDLALLYADLPGPATATGKLGWQAETLHFDLTGALPGDIAMKVSGTAGTDGQSADVVLDAGLPDISRVLPDFSGPFSAKGTVQLADGTATVDLATAGPEGAALRLAGDYGIETGLADLKVTGTADLALANRFVDGAAELSGQAVLDLTVKGPAEPASVGGTLRAANANVALPGAGITLPSARLDITIDPVHAAQPQALLAARIEANVPLIEAPGADWLALVDGPVDLGADIALLPGSRLALRNLALANGDASITGRGDLTLGDAPLAEAELDLGLADLARLKPLVPLDLAGSLNAGLGLNYDLGSGVLDADIRARTAGLSLGGGALALIDPVTELVATLKLDGETLTLGGLDLASGPLRVNGGASVTPLAGAQVVTYDLGFGLGSAARLSGLVGMPLDGRIEGGAKGSYAVLDGSLDSSLLVSFSQLRVGSGVVQDILGGDGQLSAVIGLRDGKLTVQDGRFANRALNLAGSFDGSRADLTATLDNLGRVVPELPGPVTARGQVAIGDGYDLNLTLTGPAGINARVSGPISAAMVPRLTINGTAPLAVANPFLGGSVDAQGQVAVDLTLAGQLDLSGLSGSVTVSGGRVAIAGASIALSDLSARVNLSGGQARLDAETGFNTSGRASVTGTVGLSGAMPINLTLALRRVEVVQQPTLRSILNGQLQLTGTVASGGLLSGRIVLGETEISLAFAGGGGTLLEVQHQGEPGDSRATRARAGLLGDGNGGAGGGGGNARLDLDITVSAPNQVFVRGRGLDTELGGEIRITGRAGNIVPSGGFNLIRGRLDILGRRLDVTEASIQLMGDLDPQIHLVATTSAEGVAVNIVTQGTASAPNIGLTSNPELPEEEVLALLLFGRGIETITPLQALQLANAVRTLLSGGEGIQGRLRQQFGLDELDVTTDSDGNVALRAGKYISENIYLNTEIGASGDIEVQLNLDITPNLTARGSAGSSGETSLGIFFERDY